MVDLTDLLFLLLPRYQTAPLWLSFPNRPLPTIFLPLPVYPGHLLADMVRSRVKGWEMMADGYNWAVLHVLEPAWSLRLHLRTYLDGANVDAAFVAGRATPQGN